MSKDKALITIGIVALASLAFGAASFGKILTERSTPSIDERLEMLKTHQIQSTGPDRAEFLKKFAAERRPFLPMNLAVAGDCETFLDSANFYLDKTAEVARKYPNFDPAVVYRGASREDQVLIDFMTGVASLMAFSYDDCLGNP
jgi:hypothetical protein